MKKMTLELGDVETTALIPLGSFMLFTALEAGGNYSALLRIIDIGVKKAQAILDLPTMDINGKEGGESLPLAPACFAVFRYPFA